MKKEDIEVHNLWCEKRKDKYLWRMRFKNPKMRREEKVSVSLGSGTKQAETKARRLLLDKAAKKIGISFEAASPFMDVDIVQFKQVAQIWFDDVRARIKPQTVVNRKRVIGRLCKEFGEQRMVDFTPLQIQLFFNSLKLAKTTIQNYFGIFRQIMNFAERMEIIKKNPVVKVRITYPLKTQEYFEKQKRRVFTYDELIDVLVLMRRSINPQTRIIADVLEFMFLTGLRSCEALALTSADFNGKQILVHKNLDWTQGVTHYSFTSPKTLHSYREVALSDRAIKIVEQRMLQNRSSAFVDFIDRGFIFPSRTGYPMDLGSINRSFAHYGAVSGQKKQFSTHCMRHSHISYLAESGVPQRAVMDRVGHATAAITTEIYTATTPRMEAAVLKSLENIPSLKLGVVMDEKIEKVSGQLVGSFE